MAEFPLLPEGIVLAYFIVSTMSSAPALLHRGTRRQGGVLRPWRADLVALSNSWIITNVGVEVA